jgi:hypothetical protein
MKFELCWTCEARYYDYIYLVDLVACMYICNGAQVIASESERWRKDVDAVALAGKEDDVSTTTTTATAAAAVSLLKQIQYNFADLMKKSLESGIIQKMDVGDNVKRHDDEDIDDYNTVDDEDDDDDEDYDDDT